MAQQTRALNLPLRLVSDTGLIKPDPITSISNRHLEYVLTWYTRDIHIQFRYGIAISSFLLSRLKK